MGSISNALSSSARRVTTVEFAESLCRVLGIHKDSHHGQLQPQTIGLAISGGVDSMALAALCSNVQNLPHVKDKDEEQVEHVKNIKFRAFIVDHRARAGSFEEAKAVSNVLERRGIAAEVIRTNESRRLSTEEPNFESLARRYRFKELGKACKDRGIKSLLLAHHEDDQVETILMRLIAGHRREGLIGIKEQGGMPECYGLHGVYESGDLNVAPAQLPMDSSSLIKQLDIEKGGIKIYRPLLSFSKARLVATCQHENMEWFEDHTNQDHTLTKRNAIRQMYNTHAMPAALTKPVLLGLSERIQDSVAFEDRIAELLVVTACRIKDFNTRAGTVTVGFPEEIDILLLSQNPKQDPVRIAAKILRRILFLVSPLEHIALDSLQYTLTYIFPGFWPANEPPMVKPRPRKRSRRWKPTIGPPPPKAITVAGVYLQSIPVRAIWTTGGSCYLTRTEWQLSRQPHHSHSLEQNYLNIPQVPDLEWSHWTLYDGRYWIRIQNLNPDMNIIIRPFAESDLKEFRLGLDATLERKFNSRLKTQARAEIRWTLPAIVLRGTSEVEDRVLALPSLGVQVMAAESIVSWEIRYKKVDIPGMKIEPLVEAEEGDEGKEREEREEW